MDSIHILVVDDNHINRLFFQAALKKLSCRVTTANNGLEGLNKSQSTQYDLILMDIRMDGMDGIEAAASIKQDSINQNTPIIAVSAEPIDTEQSQDFHSSILKPVSQQCLAQLLEKFISPHPTFNHQKAMETSLQDEKIVMHLRSMLIKQLIDSRHDIAELFSQQQYELLQENLHQLLGAARICAAETLSADITTLKNAIKYDNKATENAFVKLMKTVDKIVVESKSR